MYDMQVDSWLEDLTITIHYDFDLIHLRLLLYINNVTLDFLLDRVHTSLLCPIKAGDKDYFDKESSYGILSILEQKL